MDELQDTLVELIDLSSRIKQFHWTIGGPGALFIHQHLDNLKEVVDSYTDQVAERIATLDYVPDGRLTTVVDEAPFGTEMPYGRNTVKSTLRHLTVVLAGLSEAVADRVSYMDDDAASQDLLIELLRVLEQQNWLLSLEEALPMLEDE